ncbi:RodZ domain-containing protein [Shewanella insulae]|uniref:RodZ domain-containing protein n=1 Tax=Shewanella insulae TaxID=2681496 RepID=UPI002480E9E0|nr:RodZ domain-containing protein [Shewanella insulae]
MTDNQIDMLKDDADKPKDTGETLGQWLKAGRESRQITIASVAEQLNLRPSIVKDLEADNYDNIASATYVKGYVKNYARILGLEMAKVDAYLAESFPVVSAPTMQSFSRKTTRQARDGRLMLVTYLIIFVLLALLVLWWVQKSAMVADIDLSKPSMEETAELSTLAASSEPMSAQDPQAGTGIEMPRDQFASEQLAPEKTMPDQAASEQATAEQVQNLSSEPISTPESGAAQATHSISQADETLNAADDAELALSLSGDCWIKVTDADGKVLVNGLKLAGKEMNVFGQAPFKVILGAPQSLTMRLNGENIDLAKYPSGRVARLTVGSAANL